MAASKLRLEKLLTKFHEVALILKETGLSKRATVLLLSDASKVPMRQVERVLDALLSLDTTVLNPADWEVDETDQAG